MSVRRRSLAAVGLALAAGVRLARAEPDGWPARALRLIAVYPPGGVSDLVARALAQPLGDELGQPVVVEHRPGAGGAVGMAALARAAPDGYTLAFSAISPLTLQPLVAHVAYDPVRGFAPVAGVMRTPVLVVGTRALRGRGFAAMLEQAATRPGAVRWASSGVATIGHLVLAQVRRQSGLEIIHVPYQGGGRQLNDALAGQFEVLSTNVAPLQLTYIAAGRLQALAVGAPARLDALPDVPTLAELGFAAANVDSLFGVFAPGGTPPEIVERLNDRIDEALAGDELQRLLRDAHNTPVIGSVDDFAREIDADRARNQALVGNRRSLD